jgi:hypothetical protein
MCSVSMSYDWYIGVKLIFIQVVLVLFEVHFLSCGLHLFVDVNLYSPTLSFS